MKIQIKAPVKRKAAISLLVCTLALSGAGAAVAYAENTAYYVCFSHQSYAVRNANKMSAGDNGYLLENVSISSAADFYVTDNAGARWYAADDEPMTVNETGTYYYDIKFSPDDIFTENSEGWAATNCKITYRLHQAESYSVSINGESVPLTYNPYYTEYNKYYISSVKLEEGAKVAYGAEEKTISATGYYRILFTPDKERDGKIYRFDDKGGYGSGSDYKYNVYIEDAPRYFVAFKEEITLQPPENPEYTATIGGNPAYYMERYEKNTVSAEYRAPQLFSGGRDRDIKYCIYEENAAGGYRLVDDDNDEDTDFSKLRAADARWYSLSLTDNGDSYLSALAAEERAFGGWYVAGEFNGYGFNGAGEVDIAPEFRFAAVEEGDDDYNEDYPQYILRLTVTDRDLKDGDLEFCITDGKTIYKNGAEYIALNRAGEYKILFSDEHLYGRRNYRYVLETENTENREISVSSAEEFTEFAKNCTRSADYSVNLTVYLTADIDFAGKKFVPVESFSGKFLGQNHSIKNVTYADGAESTAIFSVVTRTGSVDRLEIEKASLGGKDCAYVGVIGKNYGTVTNLTVSGNIYGGSYVGAVAAYNGRSVIDNDSATVDSNNIISKAKLENCQSTATVTGNRYTGGVCGYNSGDILSCTSRGSVSGDKNAASSTVFALGGVAGYSIGKISGCENLSAVAGGKDSLYTGGVAGLCTGDIYFSFNRADVSASKYAGGVCGYFGTVENNPEDLNSFFGGMDYRTFLERFFGSDGSDESGGGEGETTTAIINYCINYGEVTAFSYAGGIVGNSTAVGLKIYNCAGSGDVSATAGSYAGGIAGYCTGAEIKSCVSLGVIGAKGTGGGKYVGGIVGYGGSVYYCASSATLSGDDFIGGIAGGAAADIIGCYTNVLVSRGEDAVNIGAIAGAAESFNSSLNSFGESVKGNYYVGADENLNGIHGAEYGENFNFAACAVTGDVLATEGMLSPLLCEDFSREFWQGGKGEKRYPLPVNFEKAEECTQFDDDEGWNKLFGEYAALFSELGGDCAKITCTVTFMEWNKDNGELFEDGEIQYGNFEMTAVIRVAAGESVAAPRLSYAQESANGKFIYEGDEARYFVSFPQTVTPNGNTVVYAEYTEIVTSLACDGGRVFAEGDFSKGTEMELVKVGDYYALKFTLFGEELSFDKVTVKIRTDGDADDFGVYTATADGTQKTESEVSGNYLKFTYRGGYFAVQKTEGGNLPFWAWLLIGMASSAAVAGIAILTVYLVKKKKSAENRSHQ